MAAFVTHTSAFGRLLVNMSVPFRLVGGAEQRQNELKPVPMGNVGQMLVHEFICGGQICTHKGGKPMTGKPDFSPDEWKMLLESVMMAGIAITAADPSALWGTLKESMASAHAVIGAAYNATSNELIKAVAEEFETAEGRAVARDGLRTQLSGKKPAEITAICLEVLKQAAALVDAKAPANAAAFKIWLRHISQAVAEASTEGGFFSFGGVRVSESEKATLAQISATLGVAT